MNFLAVNDGIRGISVRCGNVLIYSAVKNNKAIDERV
jgi:hypothetical protein